MRLRFWKKAKHPELEEKLKPYFCLTCDEQFDSATKLEYHAENTGHDMPVGAEGTVGNPGQSSVHYSPDGEHKYAFFGPAEYHRPLKREREEE